MLHERALNRTDWMVRRHREEVELGVTTSLTTEQYQDLLTTRKSWRESVSGNVSPISLIQELKDEIG
jgi:hypothetical protein